MTASAGTFIFPADVICVSVNKHGGNGGVRKKPPLAQGRLTCNQLQLPETPSGASDSRSQGLSPLLRFLPRSSKPVSTGAGFLSSFSFFLASFFSYPIRHRISP